MGDTWVEREEQPELDRRICEVLIPAGLRFYGDEFAEAKAEMWANAQLIAASPDLLAACEAALEFYGGIGLLTKNGTLAGEAETWSQLKRAIAKAKGAPK